MHLYCTEELNRFLMQCGQFCTLSLLIHQSFSFLFFSSSFLINGDSITGPETTLVFCTSSENNSSFEVSKSFKSTLPLFNPLLGKTLKSDANLFCSCLSCSFKFPALVTNKSLMHPCYLVLRSISYHTLISHACQIALFAFSSLTTFPSYSLSRI